MAGSKGKCCPIQAEAVFRVLSSRLPSLATRTWQQGSEGEKYFFEYTMDENKNIRELPLDRILICNRPGAMGPFKLLRGIVNNTCR